MYRYEVLTCVVGKPSERVYSDHLSEYYSTMETKDALEALHLLHNEDYTLPIEIRIINNQVEV